MAIGEEWGDWGKVGVGFADIFINNVKKNSKHENNTNNTPST
jgi:hypothetical protein